MKHRLPSMKRRIPAACLIAAMSLAGPPRDASSAEPTALIEDADPVAVLDALYAECVDAGLYTEPQGDGLLVCSAELDLTDGSAAGLPVVGVHEGRARHRIRFALADREAGVRVWAYPWIEVEEPGGQILEHAVTSTDYLARVQDVLNGLAAQIAAGGTEPDEGPWAEHYGTRDEWRLDAHLHAVAYCDAELAGISPDEIERQIEAAGVQPFGSSLRARCEELYEELFRFALARGVEQPSFEEYVEHRETLPPAQRRCAGRLALSSSCG